MPTPETGSSSPTGRVNLPENNLTSPQFRSLESSMCASREISKPNVSEGRALLGTLFRGLSNLATLPVNVAAFVLGGAAGKACGKTQEGREVATLALGLTVGLPFTLAGLGLSLIATALKNSEKSKFQDTFKDAFMNSNLLNFSSRLHEAHKAAQKELDKDMENLIKKFHSEVSELNPGVEPEEPLTTTGSEASGVEPEEPSFHESTVEKTNKDLQWEAAMAEVLRIGPVNYDLVEESEVPKLKEKLKVAMQENLQAFQYAPTRLRDDYDLALLAVSKNPSMLQYVGDSMKKNDEILKIAITGFGKTILYVPAEKQTEELIRLALRNDRSAFRYVNDSVKTAELVRSLINEKEVVDAKGNPTKEVFSDVLRHTPKAILLQLKLSKNFPPKQ